jgi:hypothetical protein
MWRRIVAVVWVAAALAFLVLGIRAEVASVPEGNHIAGWGMMLMTLPIGMIGGALLILLQMAIPASFEPDLATRIVLQILSWSILAVCGAFQWFVVVPFLIRRLVRVSGERRGTAASGE